MKVATCTTPVWFGSSEIIIQFLFALVTLFVALAAFRVYRLSKQKSSLLFALAFSTISGAYFIGMLLNLFVLLQVSTADIMSFIIGPVTGSTFLLSVAATIIHMLAMVTGLSLLAYINIKDRNVNVFILVLSLSFAALVLTPLIGLMFYVITSILLLFIALQQYRRFMKKRYLNTLLVALGFALLFIGNVLLAVAHVLSSMYVFGHFIMLFGYILLLSSLIRVVFK